MQERERISNMDFKEYQNNLRNNPRLTEEMRMLIESDLQFGLTIAETEEYSRKKYDMSQMKVYSKCLRNGCSKEAIAVITKEGLTGEQMAVALEFYEKGVPLSALEEIAGDTGKTAFVMKRLLQTIADKAQEAGIVPGGQEPYTRELLEQVREMVEKISNQENRYDVLNETLQQMKTAGQDVTVQNNLLMQLREKDGLLEMQQNEINEARVTIARLRNDMDGIQKEKDMLKQRTETMEQEMEEKKRQLNSLQKEKETKAPSTEMPEEKAERKEEKTTVPHLPDLEYRAGVVDENGRMVQMISIESQKKRKEIPAMAAFFSRVTSKKKINLVKLLAQKNLETEQLSQIKFAIEKGLSEKQLLVLINNRIPAEQMEEIIEIAVLENKMEEA
jgi:hypothetical protein